MIVDESEIKNRLTSETNVIHKLRGAGKGGPSIPVFISEIQSGLIIQGESQKKVAETFDISTQTVHNNFHTKGNDPEASKRRIEKRKLDAQSDAMDKLIDSLGLIGQDKLNDCNAVQLSLVAGNMAKIVERLDGNHRNENSNQVLIVYAPPQKSEHDFKVIDI